MSFKEQPLLSVWMVTYNHEKHIRQSIESVLAQKTDFTFEIVIGEDCSTDGTRAVIQELEQKYPNIIKPVYHTKNVGALRNAYEFCYPRLQGKYIACLEGDDYWTDPLKLQKQVDFLEKNPDYSLCFHRVLELRENEKPKLSQLNTSEKEETYTIEDLSKGNFISTASVVFKNSPKLELPAWFYDSPVGDYVLFLLIARHGKLKYLPDAMSVYRIHHGGIWALQARHAMLTNWLKMLNFLLQEDFNEVVRAGLIAQKERYSAEQLKILFHTDQGLFLKKLQETTDADPKAARDWLFIHYPEMLNSILNGKSYKLAKNLSDIKSKLLLKVKSYL